MNNTAVMFRRNMMLIYIIFGALIASVMQPYLHLISESRTFRDLTLQTPFHSVTVSAEAVEGDRIIIEGTMVKRRCLFLALNAYVSDGVIRMPAPIDTTIEESIWGGGSRPPSRDAETWGPWGIVNPSPNPAVSWEVYTSHSCRGIRQSNLFARGPWPEREGE